MPLPPAHLAKCVFAEPWNHERHNRARVRVVVSSAITTINKTISVVAVGLLAVSAVRANDAILIGTSTWGTTPYTITLLPNTANQKFPI